MNNGLRYITRMDENGKQKARCTERTGLVSMQYRFSRCFKEVQLLNVKLLFNTQAEINITIKNMSQRDHRLQEESMRRVSSGY